MRPDGRPERNSGAAALAFLSVHGMAFAGWAKGRNGPGVKR
jgi:hypothetical protein